MKRRLLSYLRFHLFLVILAALGALVTFGNDVTLIFRRSV